MAFAIHKQPRRILLVRTDGIGDLVLTLPAIAAVRRQFSRAHVTALVSPAADGLLTGRRYLDEILVDDPAESTAQLAQRLKEKQFDAAVIFNTGTRNCLAIWQARIPVRVCWAYKPVGLLLGNRRVALHRSHPPIHETDFTLRFVRRLGVEPEAADFSPRLDIDDATKQRVAARIAREVGTRGPLFGVHPGNMHSAYNWPASHYAELILRLARVGRVMVTGKTPETPLVEEISAQLNDDMRRRVGFLWDMPLVELAAAISQQSTLTVSSTGPMHIGGIVGTPLVALFSPHPIHSPKKWAPMGTTHTIIVAPLKPDENPYVRRDKATAVMARISVDQVLEATLQHAQQAMATGRREQQVVGSITEQAA